MNPMRTLAPVLLVLATLPAAIADNGEPVDYDTPPTRAPAGVMSYEGAPWLERASRIAEEKPGLAVAAMGLEPGDAVADIGVGTGFFARRMAREVAPGGIVYGVDIQPEMLELLEEECAAAGIDNVRPVLGAPDDPKLPPESLDWILLVDAYHEFGDPEAMLAAMHKALKPDGKVALLEYRLLGETAAHIKRDHRMSVRQVLAEWNPAGFQLIDLREFLPTQHFFVFEKRPPCPAPATEPATAE